MLGLDIVLGIAVFLVQRRVNYATMGKGQLIVFDTGRLLVLEWQRRLIRVQEDLFVLKNPQKLNKKVVLGVTPLRTSAS
uniref:Secreted protein n=1 Tax=Steinernema glaseri TaxID=37863 RepID=A0A1I7Y165_9BILA